jgi:hypothetical protein
LLRSTAAPFSSIACKIASRAAGQARVCQAAPKTIMLE